MGYPEESNEESSRLICPKCGYEQEERLDCLKCGIVFSKFIAFHAPDKTSRADSAEINQAAPPLPEDTLAFDASEVRRQIRELSRRFNEVEFERVERSQLRSDLRALERKSLSELEQLNSRLEILERLANEPPALPPAPPIPDYAELIKDLKSTQVDPLVQKLADLERRFEEIVEAITHQPDGQIVARLEGLDARVSVLETQLAGLRAGDDSRELTEATQELQLHVQALQSEVDIISAVSNQDAVLGNQVLELREQAGLLRERLQSIEDRLEHPSSVTHDTEQPGAALEEDVRYIRQTLDQIREFMSWHSQKS